MPDRAGAGVPVKLPYTVPVLKLLGRVADMTRKVDRNGDRDGGNLMSSKSRT